MTIANCNNKQVLLSSSWTLKFKTGGVFDAGVVTGALVVVSGSVVAFCLKKKTTKFRI